MRQRSRPHSLLVWPRVQAASRGAAAHPQVAVTSVIRKDVPVYSNWVGTTEGFVNAQIHPKISGYLLKQEYKDGDHVRTGQLLFQIDDREYQAAFDQALGDLAQKQADLKKNQQDFARYKALIAAQVISKQEFDHITQNTSATAAARRRPRRQWRPRGSTLNGLR